MIKKLQEFLTIEQQIELLQERHLIINNIPSSKKALQTYDYYEIINGYKQNYIIKQDNHNEIFKPNVSFEQIFSLFEFDRGLRHMVMSSLIDLEEHMRSLISYILAKHYTSEHELYLNSRNYVNCKTNNEHWTKSAILASLNHAIENPKPPVTYHLREYGNVTPWVLLKQIYMSTLFNFVRILKPELKTELIMLAYGVPKEIAEKEAIKSLFLESLIFFLDYRNMAAHGNRMYNFIPKHDVSISQKTIDELHKYNFDLEEIKYSYGLAKLTYLLDLFDYKGPYKNIERIFDFEVRRHCQMYPNDLHHLLTSTGYIPERIAIKNGNIQYTLSQLINDNGVLDVQKYNQLFKTNEIDKEVAITKET